MSKWMKFKQVLVSRLLLKSGVKPSSAMNVNAWICSCATDNDLESGLSEATVILTAF